MKPSLILGSSSPRRRELLAPHFKLRILAADINEAVGREESPRKYVRRICVEKWTTLQSKLKSSKRKTLLLTADTCVFQGVKILGKPRDAREALSFLKKLSGKSHWVATSFALGPLQNRRPIFVRTCFTKVTFRKLTQVEIKNYIRSGEWRGKAGGYAIQGRALSFVADVRGSLTNVVGLPIEEIQKISCW